MKWEIIAQAYFRPVAFSTSRYALGKSNLNNFRLFAK